MDVNPLQSLQSLTAELQILKSEVQSSQSYGHSYNLVINKINEHQEKIGVIVRGCLEDLHTDSSLLDMELKSYFTESKHIFSLLSKQADQSEDTLIKLKFICAAQLMPIDKAQTLNKMMIAFPHAKEILGSLDVLEITPKNLALNCFELAMQRLHIGAPLGLKEVECIHTALFSSSNRHFIQAYHSNGPHPTEVFDSLYKLLTSVENFESCEAINESLNEHLKTKPDGRGFEAFFNLPSETQARLLQSFKTSEDAGERSFVTSLETYQEALKKFEESLKEIPIVSVKILLEDSINVNQTFFLNVDGGTEWVFKPVSENMNYGDGHGWEIFQAECFASMLNYHGQFPVPLTIPLQVKDWLGSAQMFVKNAEGLGEIKKKNLNVDTFQLQKLVIFDLMFANSDRNDANFLFQIVENTAHIVGIDHDRCLMFRGIACLKFEYLNIEELQEPLQEEMRMLFSKEAIQRYSQILRDNKNIQNNIADSQIEWMNLVADKLSEAIDQQTPLMEVIEELEEMYKENYGIL